jgi:hypothetical protein
MSRISVLLVLTLISCDRRKGPTGEMKQAEDWGDPSNPHAEVAPSVDEEDPHAGIDMNDPHGGIDPTEMAPSEDRAIDPNKFLRGSIALTDATQGKVPASGVVFVFAKAPGGGPPLAVERVDIGGFPMKFDLTEADQMIEGTNFSGQVVISVRVDQDSDVMTRQAGDLSGTLEATIPAEGLEVKLDAVQP